MSEYIGTMFLVNWQPFGKGVVIEDFLRKQEAMQIAEQRALESWQGISTVEMVLIEEESNGETDTRVIRVWEVSPEGCIQTWGPKERKPFR